VIQVRVAEHDRIKICDRKGNRRPIALAQDLEALEQTTVEQDVLTPCHDQMSGAGDRVCRT
jgi:hypothetical protein